MNITIIEANMTGLQHAFHNNCVINAIAEFAESIKLFCSDEHRTNLAFDEQKIQYGSIQVLAPIPKIRFVRKFFIEYKKTLQLIQQSSSDVIILLSCFPPVQFFLTRFANRFKNKKIVIITHGELEGLILPHKWKVWSYPYWITACFKIPLPKNISRIVLGESIKDNLGKFSGSEDIFYIDQPRTDFRSENKTLPAVRRNIFGFVGNCLRKKGGETFLMSANLLEGKSDSEFWIVGAYDLSDSDLPNCMKLLSKPHEMLSQQAFNNALENLTYACYPYPNDSYKFTASGAVLDAIRFLKPIIYIKNDYFDCIFKDAGNIGYRCENENDFIATMQKIDAAPNHGLYEQQVKNLRKLQNKFSIENISNQLKNIIGNISSKQ